MGDRIPLDVVQFAYALPQLGPRPPRPVAWKEYASEWIVVLEDGRKLHCPKSAAARTTASPAAAPKKEKTK